MCRTQFLVQIMPLYAKHLSTFRSRVKTSPTLLFQFFWEKLPDGAVFELEYMMFYEICLFHRANIISVNVQNYDISTCFGRFVSSALQKKYVFRWFVSTFEFGLACHQVVCVSSGSPPAHSVVACQYKFWPAHLLTRKRLFFRYVGAKNDKILLRATSASLKNFKRTNHLPPSHCLFSQK